MATHDTDLIFTISDHDKTEELLTWPSKKELESAITMAEQMRNEHNDNDPHLNCRILTARALPGTVFTGRVTGSRSLYKSGDGRN